MKQRKRITLQTDVNATCAIRHTLALSVLGLGFSFFLVKPMENLGFCPPDWGHFGVPFGVLLGVRFGVRFGVHFGSILGSVLGPFGAPFWGPFWGVELGPRR